MIFRYLVILSTILYATILYGYDDFKLYDMHGQDKDNTENIALIVGGIHGNEPGSYFAPAIFVQHYTIKKHQVWVIPAINKKSVQKNARGLHGDMNRKFKHIKKNDYDYYKIQRIKKLIKNERVSIVLNLHDGHGFFRPKYENSKKNPLAWGQTSVIDQEKLDDNIKFSNLYEIAKQANEDINKDIEQEAYNFRIKNTHTKERDRDQQNSLTYFAITNNKPAFAIETSKEIKSLSLKVLYQLKSIEAYLKIIGVEFTRDFELNKENLDVLLKRYGHVNINNIISFNINSIKPYVGFFPLKRRGNNFEFSHPLGSYSYARGLYHIHIGNKHISSLKPDYFRIEDTKDDIEIEIDDRNKFVKLGSMIDVEHYFKVKAPRNVRVNVIGFGKKSDNFRKVWKKNIPKKYSIDKKHNLYRVEFYKKSLFLGMIVINFK